MSRLGAMRLVRRMRVLFPMVLIASLASPTAMARVPQGFVGMHVGAPVLQGKVTGHQLDVMVASGVENIRVVFSWAGAQPYASWSDVPAGQQNNFERDTVPTSLVATDQIVAAAAQRHLTVLPTVLYTPSWAEAPHSADTGGAPLSDATYADYMAALVRRYGPHGTFWTEHPKTPRVAIRTWQIWNEPNFTHYWAPRPFAPSYVALVHAAHDAIKHLDPGAKVVLAGLPNFSWTYVDEIYKVSGAHRYFDVVAVHPYTKYPAGVVTILQRVRSVMNRHGDRQKPMIASEVGFQGTSGTQSRDVQQLLPLLARESRRLRLTAFDFFQWVDPTDPSDPSRHFGLFHISRGRFVAKSAYRAFRTGALGIERCRVKATVATRCSKR
jgi:hypothetical protein